MIMETASRCHETSSRKLQVEKLKETDAESAPRNRWPTLSNASSGQGWNQSITVELTKAGNFRDRFRKSSPTGEKQRTTCKFFRISEM